MYKIVLKYGKFMIGLFICAVGMSLYYFCDLGLNPWNVLYQGISLHLPITIGQASQIMGFIIIIVSMFFKIFPGIGTILNMYFLGLFLDIIIGTGLLHTPATLIGKVIMCLLGVVVLCLGKFFYMGQELGAGPIDGLMLSLTKRTRFSIGTVKNSIEITAIVIGTILGGKFGIGTILSCLLGGPILQYIYKFAKKNPKELKQQTVLDLIHSKHNNI